MMGRQVWRLAVAGLGLTSGLAFGQGTKQWTTGRYDEMERGSTDGVAIRSDGTLETAPATSLLYTSGGNYIWSVAADANGNAFAGMGGAASGSAAVMRLGADGKAAKVFAGTELAVQAMRVGPDGALFVATSPDGKVYRVAKEGGPPTVVFDPAASAEKPKYLWDLATGPQGEVYVAAGAPAAVYRIDHGKTDLVFRTADQHMRCLLLDKAGMLWAGTDGGGIVYRIDPRVRGARPLAMLAAAQREITALAEDDAGVVYASGVGSKSGASLPPLPVTGAVGVSITFVQPGSTSAVSASALVPEGSEVYRVAPDGTPSRLVAFKEDVVYGLAVRDGALLVATGNRGRVYRVELGAGAAGRFSDLAHLEASQGTAVAPLAGGGLLIGTSNSGKLYRLGGAETGTRKLATYTSEVFDAGGFARWGRVEFRPDGAGSQFFVRTGNVSSPLEGWSDWMRLDHGEGRIPGGRFAQWKVDLASGSSIDQVALNYLPRNVAPVVDDIAVQLGARVAPGTASPATTTVQVTFPIPAGPGGSLALPPGDAGTGPLTGQKDRTAATVRWAAHDDNGDDLVFAVWYRGAAEKDFRLLKDKISDRFYSFDQTALPDGAYVLKIVASDGPSHPDAETLTSERTSGTFVIDTTPPVVSDLHGAKTPGGKAPLSSRTAISVSFVAQDATSPISRAEYSMDAGPWQYLEPEGKVSDGLRETYSLSIPLGLAPLAGLPMPASGNLDPSAEHVVAVRVYDRYDNVGSAKVVVR